MPPTPPQASLWTAPLPLVLASGSATRRDMLQAAGIAPEIDPARIDERAIEDRMAADGAGPDAVAIGLAHAKALAVSRLKPDRVVIGADQTLSCGAGRFHKPADRAAARRQLQALSGRSHRLTSAYCLARDGTELAAGSASADLVMRPLTDAFIDAYLEAAGASACASVGAYQLEGLGAHLFTRIDGDHFTILGLPLLGVLADLRSLGFIEG